MSGWRDRAACRESPDPDAFFAERDGVEYALGFCRRCPVRAECSETAEALDVRVGIWGGLNQTRTVGAGG